MQVSRQCNRACKLIQHDQSNNIHPSFSNDYHIFQDNCPSEPISFHQIDIPNLDHSQYTDHSQRTEQKAPDEKWSPDISIPMFLEHQPSKKIKIRKETRVKTRAEQSLNGTSKKADTSSDFVSILRHAIRVCCPHQQDNLRKSAFTWLKGIIKGKRVMKTIEEALEYVKQGNIPKQMRCLLMQAIWFIQKVDQFKVYEWLKKTKKQSWPKRKLSFERFASLLIRYFPLNEP